jgi:hypothetical protein
LITLRAGEIITDTIDRARGPAQGGAMQRLVCLSFLAALLWPHWASAELRPHRAEYSLRLGPAANALRIGTAVSDLAADCSAWKIKRDISTEISITPSWKIAVTSKLDGEEARGGSAFRYRATQIQNGAEKRTEGRVQRTPKEVRAEVTGPNGPAQITMPGATRMPISAIGYMVDRLKSGALSFPALMFDAEVITDAFLVEVEALDRGTMRAARPADRQVVIPNGKSFPVSMSFTRGARQDQKPLFTVTALVWESGVLDRLTVDTGLVSVTADLQSLEMRTTPNCPRS